MDRINHLGTLKERKQALLVESDLNRLVLRLETERLRESFGKVDSALSSVRKAGPWLLPLVSLAGIVAGGRAVRAAKARQGGWIRLGIKLLPLLLQFRHARKPAD
jgi:hypothetical protein